MKIRQYLSKIKLYLTIERKLRKKAIFNGNNHVFTGLSRIYHEFGAKKENIIIENGVWLEGAIHVQYDGKVIMHEHSKISSSTVIQCVNSVEIGAYTITAPNVVISDNNSHPVSPSFRKKMELTPSGHPMRSWKYSDNAPIKIGENVWIGMNSRICKGVTIGDNCVIGANSVVTKDIPANSVAVGNPARVVKSDIDKLSEPQYP